MPSEYSAPTPVFIEWGKNATGGDAGAMEHLSKVEIEAFDRRTGSEQELGAAVEHLATCLSCREVYRELLRGRRGGLSFTLDPAAIFSDQHLDYEMKVACLEERLTGEEREVIEAHLGVCALCREGLDDFRAARARSEVELRRSYSPSKPRIWQTEGWRRIAAVGLIVGGGILLLVILLRGNREKTAPLIRGAAPSPASTAHSSSPPTPEEATKAGASKDESLIAQVSGRGASNFLTPEELAVVDAARGGKIERPAILATLNSRLGSLRGGGEGHTASRLSEPVREVSETNRPFFRWESVPGATGYRVYLMDRSGQPVATSPHLSGEMASWQPEAPLTDGEEYMWVLGAQVQGEEIITPRPGEREARFRILDEGERRALDEWRGRVSAHFARGVLYAQAGMMTAAERELRQASRVKGRDSRAAEAGRLLRLLESWR
jgi:hypothetical protein